MRFLIALFLFPAILLADHLPDNLITRGKEETVLCGIDVIRSHDSDLLKKFGKPTKYLKYPEAGVDEAEIRWNVDGSIIRAYINADHVAYSVEVSGKAGAITKTGRGLSLGQTLADLERIYGKKYWKQGNEITLQWDDKTAYDPTEMRVKIDNGLIVTITLFVMEE